MKIATGGLDHGEMWRRGPADRILIEILADGMRRAGLDCRIAEQRVMKSPARKTYRKAEQNQRKDGKRAYVPPNY
jgi:hypothetical protein